MKITKVELNRRQQVELEYATYFDSRPFMQTRCKIILMKAEGQASQNIADQLGISAPMVNRWVLRYISEGFEGLRNKPGQGAKPIMDASDEKAVREAIEKDRLSLMKAKERWQDATGKKASQEYLQKFFIRLGARFGRIRKRPKGKPSPQLYEYKVEKLQELEHGHTEGLINLYFADETHNCTEGYVPYGWQFPGEDIYIPSQKGKRLRAFCV